MASRYFEAFGAVLVLWAWLAASSAGSAAERFEFPSQSYAGGQEFAAGKSTRNITIKGWLSLPTGGATSVPVVVVGHGSSGVGPDVDAVVRAMNAAGYAAAYFDSLTPRRVGTTATPKVVAGAADQAADAFAALKQLGADRRFDKRIAYVGLSGGGGAALVAASDSIRRRWVGNDGPSYAAHVALYPAVHLAPPPDELTRAPILIIHGDKDEYQRPARPRAWVTYVKMQRAAARVDMALLPGAPHSFMSDNLSARQAVSDPNYSLCPIMLVQGDGASRFLSLDGTIKESFGCVATRGGNIGYDARAATQAMTMTVTFLQRAFAEVK